MTTQPRRRRRDRRPTLLAAVLADPGLSYREKVFMLTALHVRAEYVDGILRRGSRSMDDTGRFALHVDYLASCMGSSAEAVRRAREGAERAGWLVKIYAGTFGRPSTYQAVIAGERRAPVRVVSTASLSDCHPYAPAQTPVRVAETATLASYGETPDPDDQAPAARDSRHDRESTDDPAAATSDPGRQPSTSTPDAAAGALPDPSPQPPDRPASTTEWDDGFAFPASWRVI